MRSLEAARGKLGGRAVGRSDRPPGTLVVARLRDGQRHLGILLWSVAGQSDIWFDDGLARRARSALVLPSSDPTPAKCRRERVAAVRSNSRPPT